MEVRIRDETTGGQQVSELLLPDVPTQISLLDLIRLRVREEVVRYNLNPTERFQGLVRPTDAEQELNGYRLREPHKIDWEKQAEAALAAFARNAFFVLVGDRQVEQLDEQLALDEASDVIFVRLVPLTGG